MSQEDFDSLYNYFKSKHERESRASLVSPGAQPASYLPGKPSPLLSGRNIQPSGYHAKAKGNAPWSDSKRFPPLALGSPASSGTAAFGRERTGSLSNSNSGSDIGEPDKANVPSPALNTQPLRAHGSSSSSSAGSAAYTSKLPTIYDKLAVTTSGTGAKSNTAGVSPSLSPQPVLAELDVSSSEKDSPPNSLEIIAPVCLLSTSAEDLLLVEQVVCLETIFHPSVSSRSASPSPVKQLESGKIGASSVSTAPLQQKHSSPAASPPVPIQSPPKAAAGEPILSPKSAVPGAKIAVSSNQTAVSSSESASSTASLLSSQRTGSADRAGKSVKADGLPKGSAIKPAAQQGSAAATSPRLTPTNSGTSVVSSKEASEKATLSAAAAAPAPSMRKPFTTRAGSSSSTKIRSSAGVNGTAGSVAATNPRRT